MAKKNNVVSITSTGIKTKTLTNTQLFSLTFLADSFGSGMSLSNVSGVLGSLQEIATAVAKTVYTHESFVQVGLRQSDSKVADTWFSSVHLTVATPTIQLDLFGEHAQAKEGLSDFAQMLSLFLELLFTQFDADTAKQWLKATPLSQRLASQWVSLLSDSDIRRAGFKMLYVFSFASKKDLTVAVHEPVEGQGYTAPMVQFTMGRHAINEALTALQHTPDPELVVVERETFEKLEATARVANLYKTSQWKLYFESLGKKWKTLLVDVADGAFARYLSEDNAGVSKESKLQVDLLIVTYYNPRTKKYGEKRIITKVHYLTVGKAEDYVSKQQQLNLLADKMSEQISMAKAARAIRAKIAEPTSVEIGA